MPDARLRLVEIRDRGTHLPMRFVLEPITETDRPALQLLTVYDVTNSPFTPPNPPPPDLPPPDSGSGW